jgi:drug/metabolite transporter (DMT)-like permease
VLFGVYVFPRYKVRLPSLSDLARYFAISASMIFYFWAMFEALRYTTPLNTAITYTVVPLFSAVYGIFLLKERVSFVKFAVLFAAMLGAVWVIIDGSLSRLAELDFNKGDLIFLAGCLCIGLYSPLSKKLHKTEPTPVLTLWTMITGTVWLLLIANVKILKINFSALDTAFFAGVAYITVFATIATFFIVQYSSKKLPVSEVMSYIYLTPVFVIIIQALIGKGLPHTAVIPGVAASVVATFYFLRS